MKALKMHPPGDVYLYGRTTVAISPNKYNIEDAGKDCVWFLYFIGVFLATLMI
jgi:hypothetical protein